MNMYPNQVNPALALQMGWDPVAINDDDVVTLIRRKVILEEVVISREKFDQMNQLLENDDIDENEEYWNDFDWKDSGCEDFTIENTVYTAWSGDVTSCTDDCVMFYDNEWFETYEPMTLQNS